jgi:hypothetical protein
MHPVLAQDELLTRAQVYKLINQAKLLPLGQNPRPAKVDDILVPLDALYTAARSRADLFFNEGTLARIGADTVFRFRTGMRSFELRNGSILALIKPGLGVSTIVTPEAIAVAQGTVLWGQHNRATQTTLFGSLTNNLTRPILIFNRKGEGVVKLQAGQAVAVTDGKMQPIQNFNLQAFYQSCSLANDLGQAAPTTSDVTPPPIQQTLQIVRPETTTALNQQLQLPQPVPTDANKLIDCPALSGE